MEDRSQTGKERSSGPNRELAARAARHQRRVPARRTTSSLNGRLSRPRGVEGGQLWSARLRGRPLDGPVARDHVVSQIRQHGSAPSHATELSLDNR